ncbi:biotin/lipoyl-binding protein [bacterium]|nr:biotin/lipoyl-binding protein [bacterium]
MTSPESSSIKSKVILRVIISILVIVVGIIGMRLIANMKKPPAEVVVEEIPIKVEAITVNPENVDVYIQGYGEVIVLNTVNLAPEVAGKIIRIHPRLEIGQLINQGEVLFEIDPQDYRAAYQEAFAAVQQTQNTIERLKQDYESSKLRIKTLVRNRELVKEEFDRVKRLFSINKIGTQSDLDTAERSYNSAKDQVDQMRQSLENYPLQIKETEYVLMSSNARLSRAGANLERCVVKAPFNGRLKTVSLETGQYVAPGQGVLTLVDDSKLELHIPLDSVDARKWLPFEKPDEGNHQAWFSSLEPLPVKIKWTEDISGHVWEGILDRVVKYDKLTRTLTIAIRVERPLSITNGTLPLVEGMFCAVTISGKKMHLVFRLPRWAVSFNNTVYVAKEKRLQTVSVEVVRIQDDEVFVSKGLKTGDNVIITRLVDPLENSLLEFVTKAND